MVVEAGGGSVTWLGPQNYDNLGPDAAKLIDTAVSNGATAIIGPDWVPEAEDAAFKRVVDKGIPLWIYNAGGLEAADKLGAINYIGSDDHEAGKAGGEYLGEQGRRERPVRQHPARSRRTARRAAMASPRASRPAAGAASSSRCRRRTSATPPRCPRPSRPRC